MNHNSGLKAGQGREAGASAARGAHPYLLPLDDIQQHLHAGANSGDVQHLTDHRAGCASDVDVHIRGRR